MLFGSDKLWQLPEEYLMWCLKNHARKLETSSALYCIVIFTSTCPSSLGQCHSKPKLSQIVMPEVKSKTKSIAVRLIYIWGNQSWLLTSRMFPMDAVAMLAHAVVTVAALRLHAATGENLFYRVAKCRGSHGYISQSRSSQIWKKLGTNCVSKLGHFANQYSSSLQNYRSAWPFQSTSSKTHIKWKISAHLV